MADELLAPPTVEGTAPESAPQATPPISQETGTLQDTVPAQVESQQSTSQSPLAERPKPSDFYRTRKEMKALRDQIDSLTNLVRDSQKARPASVEAPATQTPEELEKAFYSNPRGWFEKQVALLKEQHQKEIQALKDEEIPKILETRTSQAQLVGKKREALEMLFPKTDTSPHDNIEERATSDPSRFERIDKIMKEYGLVEQFQVKPAESARLILKLLELETKAAPKNPAVPQNKARMASVATGAPTGANGGKKMTLDEIQKAKNRLLDAANENPSLRTDERWLAERKNLTAQLDQLIKTGEQQK